LLKLKTKDNEDLSSFENEELPPELASAMKSAPKALKRKIENIDPLQTSSSLSQVQIKRNYLFGTNQIGDSSSGEASSTTTSTSSISNKRNSKHLTHQIASVFKNKIDFFNGAPSLNKPVLKQQQPTSSISAPPTLCYICNEKVFLMERLTVLDCIMHATCFRCSYCSRMLRSGYYSHYKDPLQPNSKCNVFRCLF
jgi:hypothetical protein